MVGCSSGGDSGGGDSDGGWQTVVGYSSGGPQTVVGYSSGGCRPLAGQREQHTALPPRGLPGHRGEPSGCSPSLGAWTGPAAVPH